MKIWTKCIQWLLNAFFILNIPLHDSNKMIYSEIRGILYRYGQRLNASGRGCSWSNTDPTEYISKPMTCCWISLTWAAELDFHVLKLLCENGFGFVWINQGVGNDELLIYDFKERSVATYQQP